MDLPTVFTQVMNLWWFPSLLAAVCRSSTAHRFIFDERVILVNSDADAQFTLSIGEKMCIESWILNKLKIHCELKSVIARKQILVSVKMGGRENFPFSSKSRKAAPLETHLPYPARNQHRHFDWFYIKLSLGNTVCVHFPNPSWDNIVYVYDYLVHILDTFV